MRDAHFPDEPAANTPEGWFAENTAQYQFLVDHDPPRAGSFLLVLKADIRSRQVLRYWATGGGIIGAGAAAVWVGAKTNDSLLSFSGLALVIIGACWLAVCLWLFLGAMRNVRFGRLLRGEIHSLERHPLARGYSVAKAKLADGRYATVSVPTAPASVLIDRDGRAEVLFLAAPDGRQGCAIGIRAAAENRLESAAESSSPAE